MSDPILKIFDPNRTLRLKIDAIWEGLGALLEQNHWSLENPQWHPIGYSSCAVQDYEKQYAKIEKATQSIVFGVELSRNIYIVINLQSLMTPTVKIDFQ